MNENCIKDIESILNTSEKRICKACGLYLNQLPVYDKSIGSKVFWVGLSSVLIEGEDEKVPLSPKTRSGALISRIELPYLDDVSFYKTNVVKCLPLENNKIRYPLKHEMEKCYPNLVEEISFLKPSIIFLLGKQVAQFILKKHKIDNFALNNDFNYEAFTIDNILFVPVHHPSYILVYKRKFIENYIKGISSFFNKATLS